MIPLYSPWANSTTGRYSIIKIKEYSWMSDTRIAYVAENAEVVISNYNVNQSDWTQLSDDDPFEDYHEAMHSLLNQLFGGLR